MSREPEIMESQVMWEPDSKRNTHMDRFRAAVSSSCGLRLGERRAGAGGEALWLRWRLAGLCFPGAGITASVRPPLSQRGARGVLWHPPWPAGTEWSGLPA